MRSTSGYGLLADGMAHDFKNLLQVINGSASMALEFAKGNEEQQRELGKILEASHRGSRLLKRLLSIGNKSQFDPRPVNLNRLVRDFMELFGSSIKKDIFCQMRLGASLEMVFGDPDAIEQILLNLLFNACEAMPDGGILVVDTSNGGQCDASSEVSGSEGMEEYIRLTVRDSGIGIPPRLIERIFEPYFTTKVAQQGCGMGLSMVSTLLREQNGRIEVKSEPDKGSIFHIFLPVYREAEVE